MAKNQYKGKDRWTSDGLGIQINPLSPEKKKDIAALKKEMAAEKRKNNSAAKKKGK